MIRYLHGVSSLVVRKVQSTDSVKMIKLLKMIDDLLCFMLEQLRIVLKMNRVVLFSGVKKFVMSNDAAEFSLRVLEWYEITP